MRGLFFVLAVCLVFTSSTVVRADGANRKKAKAAFKEAKKLFEEEKYAEAARRFRQANRLNPSWKLLYNIGQSEAAAKHYAKALVAFESYLAKGGDEVTQRRSEELLSEVQRLKAMVGVIEIDGKDGDVVKVNGANRGALPKASRVKVSLGKVRVQVKRDGELLLNPTSILVTKKSSKSMLFTMVDLRK